MLKYGQPGEDRFLTILKANRCFIDRIKAKMGRPGAFADGFLKPDSARAGNHGKGHN